MTKHNFQIGDVTENNIAICASASRNPKSNRIRWKCQCHCGEFFLADQCSLGNGRTKSCGCMRRNRLKARATGTTDINGTHWCEIVGGTKRRGRIIPMTITIQDAQQLLEAQNHKCALTNLPIETRKWNANLNKYDNRTASLDRIDSNKGYHIDNVMWVHKDVNRMKMDLPLSRVLEIAKLIANNSSLYT